MTLDVFIWGSCITRDTVEFSDYLSVEAYVARQSWISAGNDASSGSPGHGELASRFQRDVTEGDTVGNALRRVADAAAAADVVVLDLCDERLGVVWLPDGSFVTRSVEKLANGSQKAIDDTGDVLALGEAAHFAAWAHAGRDVVAALAAAGVLARTILVAPDWALVADDGSPTPLSFGVHAVDANLAFETYYAEAERLGIAVSRVRHTVAASDHLWGPAPFHYNGDTYRLIEAAILRHAAGAQASPA